MNLMFMQQHEEAYKEYGKGVTFSWWCRTNADQEEMEEVNIKEGVVHSQSCRALVVCEFFKILISSEVVLSLTTAHIVCMHTCM